MLLYFEALSKFYDQGNYNTLSFDRTLTKKRGSAPHGHIDSFRIVQTNDKISPTITTLNMVAFSNGQREASPNNVDAPHP